MPEDGQKISGKTTIPIGEMAKGMLDKIFPQLTKEQIDALKAGYPVPPSPDWVPPSGAGYLLASAGYLPTEPLQDAIPLTPKPLSTDSLTGWEASSKNKPAQGQGALLEDNKKLLEQAKQNARTTSILEAIVSTSTAPLVTCILVFGQKERMRRARKAVNQFVAQSYPHKQLVIVNATDIPITTVPHPQIKELVFPPDSVPLTGTMRNFAIDNADGDLLYPHWDDDDIYDKHLLAYMMNGRVPGKATLLNSQIRVDIKNAVAYLHTDAHGIPNTMLVPKTVVRYKESTGGEDIDFWVKHWGVRTTVLDNKLWPTNTLKTVVYDGNNVSALENFMVDHAKPEYAGRFDLTPIEIWYLRTTLETFGVRASTRNTAEQLTDAIV